MIIRFFFVFLILFKVMSQNYKCEGNNFIKTKTGYRETTQCVCATDQCKQSLHIDFVT